MTDIGDGWFALRADGKNLHPGAFLYLTDACLEAYIDAMSDADVAGAFGPRVGAARARHSLLLLHLEEALCAGGGITRYVFIERDEIQIYGTIDSLPVLPPGDFEWRSEPS